jgi:acyl-CoA synthetase (NDP forming)
MVERNFDRLLRPRSVAIVGASDKPGSLSMSVLGNLTGQDYAGDIHLINPKRDQIAGRKCLPDVASLPAGVDAAVLVIPRAAVLETVRQLGQRGVGAAVIFSAGFGEAGAEGLAEQREIARIADETGMVVEGPNCLGFTNFIDRIALTFAELPVRAPKGPAIGIVSQSGAMAAVVGVTLLSREVDLSYFVSTGNEAASGVEDYVDYLVDDADTAVIAMVVESFRKPAAFLAAAARARAAGKPIVVLHPGQSSAARESAATHTGAMAGDYQVMKTKVERAGVLVVETIEELGDVSEILLRAKAFGTGGTGVLAESGAYKALTLDLAEREALPLPEVHDEDSPVLRAALPDFVPVSNPLDLTAQGLVDPDMYRRVLIALNEDDRFGAVLMAIIQTDVATCNLKFPPIIKAIEEADLVKPVIFAGLDEGAIVPAEYIARLRALGVPYFPTSERVIRALSRIAAWRARDLSVADTAPAGSAALAQEAGVVPEYRAKAILGPIGVPFPKAELATTLDEAKAAAAKLGYPLVLKAQSADLSHKSDAGGVIVGLKDEAELAEGWDRLNGNIAHHKPGLVLDGVLVEAMGERGLELIVGARSDPDWGPLVLVGFGGVQAEILKDVRLLAPDLPRAAILAELDLLKSAALLHGFRGSPALDVDAVADIVEKIGQLLLSEPRIREIDLNPVVLYPKGKGAIALDALMWME